MSRLVSAEPSSYQLAILAAFTKRQVPVYAGTVSPAVKAERRRRNRVAAASRRINCRRSK